MYVYVSDCGYIYIYIERDVVAFIWIYVHIDYALYVFDVLHILYDAMWVQPFGNPYRVSWACQDQPRSVTASYWLVARCCGSFFDKERKS